VVKRVKILAIVVAPLKDAAILARVVRAMELER
jgi:hypothetical protein